MNEYIRGCIFTYIHMFPLSEKGEEMEDNVSGWQKTISLTGIYFFP